jgi:hypothetical protein
MVSETQQTVGWRVGETMRRCADPNLLAQWLANHRKWVAAGRRTRFIFRNEQVDGHEAVRHNDQERAAQLIYSQNLDSYARLQASLLELLRAGGLLAWGRRDSPLASLTPLPESAWNYLRIVSVEKSVIAENTKAKIKIFDLRFFPVIEAPDAVERLDGKTLVEAFQICVVDDPQVAVLNKRAGSVRGEPASFGYDWESYRAAWSVEHGRRCAAEGAVGFMKKFDDPIKYHREVAAKAAAGRRFAKLIDLLATGLLEAEGIPSGGGRTVAIPRSIWRRDRTYIDLINGDLLELNPHSEDHTTALTGPTFTGLMLSKPQGAAGRFEPDGADFPAITKPRRSTEQVVTKTNAEAACVNWLSDLMRASPNKRIQTRNEYWQQAQSKWPGKLAHRGFERAWGSAVRLTEASAWSASGRPPKSSQR